MVTLDPHQHLIHEEMLKYPRYAAFMPTGSGKTITALETLKALKISAETLSASNAVNTRYIMLIINCRGSLGIAILYFLDFYKIVTNPQSIIFDHLSLLTIHFHTLDSMNLNFCSMHGCFGCTTSCLQLNLPFRS